MKHVIQKRKEEKLSTVEKIILRTYIYLRYACVVYVRVNAEYTRNYGQLTNAQLNINKNGKHFIRLVGKFNSITSCMNNCVLCKNLNVNFSVPLFTHSCSVSYSSWTLGHNHTNSYILTLILKHTHTHTRWKMIAAEYAEKLFG